MSEKMPKSLENNDAIPHAGDWANETARTLDYQRKDLARRAEDVIKNWPEGAIPQGAIATVREKSDNPNTKVVTEWTVVGAHYTEPRDGRPGRMSYLGTHTDREGRLVRHSFTEDQLEGFSIDDNDMRSAAEAQIEATTPQDEKSVAELGQTDQDDLEIPPAESSAKIDVDAELAAGILRVNERGDRLEKDALAKINSMGRYDEDEAGANEGGEVLSGAEGAEQRTPEEEPDEKSEGADPEHEVAHNLTRKEQKDAELAALAEKYGLPPEAAADLQALSDKYGVAEGGESVDEDKKEGSSETEKATTERAEKLDAITAELDDTMVGRRLKDKLGEYAGAKAQWETKTGWIGRRKREEALKQAEAALFAAQKEYTDALVARRKEAEMYEGEESELKQMMSDDFFDEFRKLDTNARTATLEARKSMIENRKPWQRGMATVGRWLNGGKGKGWVRNALPGAAAGFGVGMAGVGIPITIVAGAAGAAGVYRMSRGAELDTRLDNYQQQTMTDEEYEKYRKTMTESAEADKDTQADRLAQEFFGRSREMGKEDMSAAKKKAASNTKKFMVGFGAGNLAANAYNLITADAAAQPGGGEDAPSPEPDPSPEDNPTDPGGETEPDGGGPLEEPSFEFPDGSSSIHAGEGWFNQFADMGFDQSQVRELFADSGLMDKLVDQGAAYPDNSATIGGYGINMPASGHLSPEVMETIRQAAISKGFVS